MSVETFAAVLVLTIAAYIDWKEHRVPNWLTFGALGFALAYHAVLSGYPGLGYALIGAFVGLATLIVMYALGGMGAGDVKLMAAIGAWVGATATLQAFVWIAVIGGIMGAYSMYCSGQWQQRLATVGVASKNLASLKTLSTGSEKAPAKILLPYGVPIAFGFYAYFLIGGIVG
ncbi:A24 family peptidase [bacterium]|nr:A24 family peptidase [bacterium]